jgi:hypothetical protein
MVGDLRVSPIFPSNRTLCPASPSLQWVARVGLPHLLGHKNASSGLRYYDPLRLPNVLFGSLRSSLVLRYLGASSCSWFSTSGGLTARRKAARQYQGVLFDRFAPFSGDSLKETSGSPKFPGYLFEHMPWSKTPVVSCVLALMYSRLLPSASSKRRLSSGSLDLSFCPRLYIFRGSIQSLHPCSAWFRTPLARLTRRLCY